MLEESITIDLPDQRDLRLLLVDDDPCTADLVRCLLDDAEETKDWTIESVSTPKEAMRTLRQSPFHLCLVDYQLAGCTGIEVIQMLRVELPSIPCVLLTGSTDRKVDLAAMDAGAFAFLSKDELDNAALDRTLRYAVGAARQQIDLVRRARRDGLTGLYNRAALEERLGKAMAKCERQQPQMLGIAVIDLDGFKTVNDTFGHQAGDRLLQTVAKRLSSAVRTYDTVARVGGDEFVVVFEELDGIAEAERLAARLVRALESRLDNGISVSASVGMAIYPGCGKNAQDALSLADRAMYSAKRAGKDQFRIIRGSSIEREVLPKTALEVREAARSGALHLVFQPQIALETGNVEGYEALVRFRTPSGEVLSACSFVPELERNGAILGLDLWVVSHAPSVAPPGSKVSVNLSAQSLLSSDFIERVRVPSGFVEVELTERAFAADEETIIERIHVLRRLGYRIALDDFGSGYASLARFARLSVDTLKIDRCFISGIGDPKNRSILKSLVLLAELNKLRLVAEGVESLEQSRVLQALKVPSGQGYLLGRPMAVDQIDTWRAARVGALQTG